MAELLLDRDTRLALRGQAHGLDPVVLLGANGLTDAVLKEIDRALLAHELIKIRVPGDDRDEREAMYNEMADKLGGFLAGGRGLYWRRWCKCAVWMRQQERRDVYGSS